jgi:alkylated DNA repair dioxygenase AlkB
MRYAPEVISREEEEALLDKLPALPFKQFEFHGFLGKRRVVSFGWRHDFNGGGLGKAGAIPEFLLPVRERAAHFAGLQPSALEHVLLIEYAPGASIGWHKDRPAFDDRHFASISVHVPAPPQGQSIMGSSLIHGRAALCVSVARLLPHRVGA